MKQEKLHFVGQDEGEEVAQMLSRHPFILIRNGIAPIIVGLIAIIAPFSGSFFGYNLLGEWYIVLTGFLLLIFSITWWFYIYFLWLRDKYIITNKRIIDIEQVTLFHRSQKEAPLERIQDVETEIKGLFPSVLHYGNVIVQTASDTILTLDDVPYPEMVQKTIMDLVRDTTSDVKKNETLIQKMIDLLRGADTHEIAAVKEQIDAVEKGISEDDTLLSHKEGSDSDGNAKNQTEKDIIV